MATSTIELTQREVPGGVPSSFSSSIYARFASGPASANPCVITTSSNCTTTVCTSDGGLSETVVTLSSAGTLSIAGTLVDGGISLMPRTNGTYYDQLNTQLWAGGETLTLSATGAVVPAFSAQTVVAPLDIVVTAPSCATNNCGTLSRSTPLTVSWTGGGSSTVDVDLTVNDSVNLRVGKILCTFPASAGTGVIPTGVLATVPAGQGFLTIKPTGSTSFAAGAWMVSIIAIGQGVGGLVMVQ